MYKLFRAPLLSALCPGLLLAALLCVSACAIPMPKREARIVANQITQRHEQEQTIQRLDGRITLMERQIAAPRSPAASYPYWENRRSMPDAVLYGSAAVAEQEVVVARSSIPRAPTAYHRSTESSPVVLATAPRRPEHKPLIIRYEEPIRVAEAPPVLMPEATQSPEPAPETVVAQAPPLAPAPPQIPVQTAPAPTPVPAPEPVQAPVPEAAPTAPPQAAEQTPTPPQASPQSSPQTPPPPALPPLAPPAPVRVAESTPAPARAAIQRAQPPTVPPMPSAAEVLPEQQLYKEALNIYFNRRYAEAYILLMQFAHFYPDSRLTGNVWYWRGETLYGLACYEEADECFSTLSRLFPKHHKVPDALLMLVQCRVELGRGAAALEILRKLEAEYPDSDQTRAARRKLGR